MTADPTEIPPGKSFGPIDGSLPVGTVVESKYQIVGFLGQGGMGTVYKAADLTGGRFVALKVLDAALACQPGSVARFRNEVTATSKIGHPSIISIYHFSFLDSSNEQPYFAMEYLARGEPLSGRITDRPLPIGVARKFFEEVMRGLEAAHAHESKIVHRDLKPDNLWVGIADSGETFAKILDFGIVKLKDGLQNTYATSPGAVLGTPLYMSPEQFIGGEVDHRTDIYAMGGILYTTFTRGKHPFEADSIGVLYAKVLTEPPLPPSRHDASMDRELEQLILRCLAKDPAERPQTMSELRLALDRILRRLDESEVLSVESDCETLVQGTVVDGRYEIVRMLGRGGMGTVYEARDLRNEGQVALKVLAADLAATPESVDRFCQEIKATRAIHHTNIIALYDFGSLRAAGNQPYFVMEYLAKGESLAQRLKRGSLTVREARKLFREALSALAAVHAHELRIVHRDLKPDNLWIGMDANKEPCIKIFDFGIAKLDVDSGGPSLTVPGTVLGTPLFMSPEQLSGKAVDVRTDIYAMGCVLYASFTGGKHPFDAPTPTALIGQVLTAAPIPPSKREKVDSDLERLILECLAKDPAKRPESAEVLGARLDAIFARLETGPRPKYRLVVMLVLIVVAISASWFGRTIPRPRDRTNRQSDPNTTPSAASTVPPSPSELRTVVPTVAFPERVGYYSVTTNVDNASIYVDGALLASNVREIAKIPIAAGHYHTLKIAAPGRRNYTRTFSVSDGTTNELVIQLESVTPVGRSEARTAGTGTSANKTRPVGEDGPDISEP